MTRRQRQLRLLLRCLHLAVLPVLALMGLLSVVAYRQQPMYGWIAGTPVEDMALRLLATGWQQKSDLQQAAADVLAPAERTAGAALRQRLAAIQPSHAIRLRSGELVFGQLRERPSTCELLVYNGRQQTRRVLLATDIAERQPLVFPAGELTAADLRFLSEFPDYNPYFLPPCTIVTKGDFARALALHTAVAQVDDALRSAFGPLLAADPADRQGLRLCDLADRAEFLRVAAAGGELALINAEAFFDRRNNRLVLGGDTGSGPVITRQLELLRHEGAHALAASLGLFPRYDRLPLWLEEGLAQYCERLPLGQDDPARLRFLREAQARGELLPWPELLQLEATGRGALPEPRLQLAYAQSWLLFRHLMAAGYREHLFRFILAQRQSPSLVTSEAGVTALLNELRLTPCRLEHELARELAPPAWATPPLAGSALAPVALVDPPRPEVR